MPYSLTAVSCAMHLCDRRTGGSQDRPRRTASVLLCSLLRGTAHQDLSELGSWLFCQGRPPHLSRLTRSCRYAEAAAPGRGAALEFAQRDRLIVTRESTDRDTAGLGFLRL